MKSIKKIRRVCHGIRSPNPAIFVFTFSHLSHRMGKPNTHIVVKFALIKRKSDSYRETVDDINNIIFYGSLTHSSSYNTLIFV